MKILWIVVIALLVARVGWRFFGRGRRTSFTSPTKHNKKPISPWRRDLFTIGVFAKTSVKRYFRDKVAIFFTVAFPLIFLFVFGALSGNNDISFNVALINQSDSQFSKQFVQQLQNNKSFKIKPDVSSLSDAKARMSRSEIDVTIILPASFGAIRASQNHPSGQATVLYDQNSEQAAQTIAAALQGVFQGINTKLVKEPTPFSVATKTTNQNGLSKFDYTFSGLLGFSIIGLGIFGPVNYFPEMKKQGVLRRLHITPLRVWQFFVSSVLSNAVIGLFSISVMFAVAYTVFHFRMHGNFLELAVLIVFGILCIFGIGLAIGGWAKNENQAAPLSNIIVFPMMFLSGTFFPRFAMPIWLQHISGFLPLTPIIDGIRMVATEGQHLTQIGPQLLEIGIWTVIIYAVAFRVFRWE